MRAAKLAASQLFDGISTLKEMSIASIDNQLLAQQLILYKKSSY